MKEAIPKNIRIDDVGPVDKNGDRTFTVRWHTDYTPSKPFPHERAQVFHTNLLTFMNRQLENNIKVEVIYE